jgi:hypothetical protein
VLTETPLVDEKINCGQELRCRCLLGQLNEFARAILKNTRQWEANPVEASTTDPLIMNAITTSESDATKWRSELDEQG